MRRISNGRAAIALWLGLGLGLTTLSPLQAQTAPDGPNLPSPPNLVASYDQAAIPHLLNEDDAAYYTRLFDLIDREDWAGVKAMFAQRKNGILHQIALAEYYTHAHSPKVTADEIARWFGEGVELPQAAQLGRLGAKRGLEMVPSLPPSRGFTRQPMPGKRTRPRSVNDGTMPADIRAQILAAISNDDPRGAQTLLFEIDPQLSPEARAEWRQRVAWSYYIENDDASALAMAQSVAEGGGAWVAEGEWVAGLAAWRMGDCEWAAAAFERAAGLATNAELRAAANYWASRSQIRCGKPQAAEPLLRAAASSDETLYGMLAYEQLGIALPALGKPTQFTADDWRSLKHNSNVRVATALSQIGRFALADEVLAYQAKIGNPGEYIALGKLARALGLPRAQLWMGHHAPYGMRADRSLRFPKIRWQPSSGWQIEPALAFAHALQESNFRIAAVSRAKARGLMQITPITVRQHAARLQMNASHVDLADPRVNLAFGQRNLEMLRDSASTQGLLPKIMAAYNAGLAPVARWNEEIRDQGDPLLWMESIPYWETRGYVAIVMRNYWMYEREAGTKSISRSMLAQGRWPGFPSSAPGQGPNAMTGQYAYLDRGK